MNFPSYFLSPKTALQFHSPPIFHKIIPILAVNSLFYFTISLFLLFNPYFLPFQVLISLLVVYFSRYFFCLLFRPPSSFFSVLLFRISSAFPLLLFPFPFVCLNSIESPFRAYTQRIIYAPSLNLLFNRSFSVYQSIIHCYTYLHYVTMSYSLSHTSLDYFTYIKLYHTAQNGCFGGCIAFICTAYIMYICPLKRSEVQKP